jgi:pyruvate/2-oxoglutarate dehydrogenase complex dihydrolipoamide dehydrogenase (E3) component
MAPLLQEVLMERINTDICVIGAGAGGLSVAAGAAQLGARVVMIESNKMGGDCLNYGCIPSKALITAGQVAYQMRHSSRFGVFGGETQVNWSEVQAHIRGVVEKVAIHDSQERFEGLGVRVIREVGFFSDSRTVCAGETEISAKRFVIATGSYPSVPLIPGLADTPFFTNETIFENQSKIGHLIVIGGGPIGLEVAQAVRRLGAQVTVLEIAKILPNDDLDLVSVVRDQLKTEGIQIKEGVVVKSVSGSIGAVSVKVREASNTNTIIGTHLLVATGRRPNLAGLNLESAGIVYSADGIIVDRRQRTSNGRVFAIGDVVEGWKFTHAASYQASLVLQNLLFRLPKKSDYRAFPRVTFTSPELAQIGMTLNEAEKTFDQVRVITQPLGDNDRAQTNHETDGLIKVVTSKRGVVLGAGIVGANAGEVIQSWALPIARKMKIKQMFDLILPYPTLGEINKRAAGAFYAPTLFSERTRALVRFLLKFY